jgi:glycosyltransferase involved in cell wall biosynthesis
VPAYNEGEAIATCLRALVDQSLGPAAIERKQYEIIVVDDASTDGTASLAKAAGADVVLTIAHGGPAVARNAGLQVARGEFVLFTDADCAPMPGWIARMVAPFEDPEVVGVKGSYRTKQRELMARLVQLEFEIRYERMARFREIDFIDTYAAAYRRQVLLQEGGFDSAYPFPANEDVDLSFRLANKGYRMVFVPEAWVFHVHPETLGAYLKRKMRVGYWRGLLYTKHPEKIAGDSHTDPWLKPGFALAVTAIALSLAALVTPALAVGAVVALLAFGVTVIPFVGWALPRDPGVALIWPAVAFMRVLVQGGALVLGYTRSLLGSLRRSVRR